MRRSFGQGNGPTRVRTLRANRRTASHVRTVDERDIGNRPEARRVVDVVDPTTGATTAHDVSACDVFGCELCLAAYGTREVG